MARESISDSRGATPDPDVLDGLLADIRYVPGTFDDDGALREARSDARRVRRPAPAPLNRVFYLSTAPEFFPVISGELGEAGLHQRRGRRGTRIVIEKPFGYDLASARALNAAC